jgi:hypothetical protein
VLDGIRELIAKYEIDGIHFDDYFYPTTSTDFDAASYAEYKKSTENPLPLADWRRNAVNTLISACYTAIKYANRNIVFSISPTASLESNYENLYADKDVKAFSSGNLIASIVKALDTFTAQARKTEEFYYRSNNGVPTIGDVNTNE